MLREEQPLDVLSGCLSLLFFHDGFYEASVMNVEAVCNQYLAQLLGL